MVHELLPSPSHIWPVWASCVLTCKAVPWACVNATHPVLSAAGRICAGQGTAWHMYCNVAYACYNIPGLNAILCSSCVGLGKTLMTVTSNQLLVLLHRSTLYAKSLSAQLVLPI